MGRISQKKIGVVLSYTNLFISTLIPFFYTPIMLSLLGQAEYGLYSLSSSVTSYLNLLNFGMTTTVLRYIIKFKSEENEEELRNLIGLFTIIYSAISLIIIVVGIILSINCDCFFAKGLSVNEISILKKLIIVMTLTIPISLMGSTYSSVLLAYERFVFKYSVNIIGSILLPVLNLVVLCAGYASIGMAIAGLCLNILFFPINVYYCYKKLNISVRFDHLPMYLLKDILSFSFIVLLSSLADLLFWSTDKVLIGSYLGSVQVAIYNVGGTFTSIFQNMASTISSIFAPQANELVFQKKDIEESSKLMIKVGRIQYLIISLVLSGFIVFGQLFLRFWAGEGYALSYYVALLTMVPLTVPLIQNMAFTTIMAMNKHKFRSKMYIIISFANLISTWLVLPVFGVIGAALCTSFSYVIGQGIILNIYYWKIIKLDIANFWFNIVKMSVIPICLGFLFFIILKLVCINSFINLLIWILGYSFVFIILSWIFTMNEYEKGLIKGFFNKLFRRLV